MNKLDDFIGYFEIPMSINICQKENIIIKAIIKL